MGAGVWSQIQRQYGADPCYNIIRPILVKPLHYNIYQIIRQRQVAN